MAQTNHDTTGLEKNVSVSHSTRLETTRSEWKKKRFPGRKKTLGLEKKRSGWEKKTFEVGNHTFGLNSWKNLGWKKIGRPYLFRSFFFPYMKIS